MPITHGSGRSDLVRLLNACNDAFQSAAFPFHLKYLMMELLSVSLGVIS